MITLKIWGLMLLCFNAICQETGSGTGSGTASGQEGIPPRVHQLIILDNVPIENVIGMDVLKLECTASGNPVPKIEWSFNQVKFVPNQPFSGVDGTEKVRHKIEGGKLTITEVRGRRTGSDNLYDTGRYRCIATNEMGTVFAEMYINVRVMGVFNPGFQFENDPTKHRPVVGQKFIVPCPGHIKGYGTTIRWGTVDSQKIIDYWLPGYTPRLFQTVDGSLVYSVVLEDDIKESRNSGGPRCILINYGITRFSNQQVLYEAYDRKIETRKPELLALLEPQMSAPIESSFSMICGALGNPVPKYRWEYQGKELIPLRPGGNELNFEFFEFLNNRLELRIRRVTEYSGGTFKCYAYNDLGEVWTIGQLSVAIPPKFNIFFPDEIQVPFENAFELRCNASGFPYPRFEWYQNSTQLKVKDLRRTWTENEDNQGSVLKFTQMTFADNGIYICIAINTQDTITQSTFIKVRAMAPVFEIPLDDPIYLFRTENMMIHCQPAAGPIPTFTWSKDSIAIVIIPGGRFDVFPNGTLLIRGVLSTDSGVYKCLAENSLGKAESSGTAIVLEPTIITHPPVSQGHQIGFQGIQLFCGASWDPRLELRIEWSKGGVKMAKFDNRIYIEKRTAGPPRILYINNLTIDDAGNYSCHAFTKVGNVVSEQTRYAYLIVKGPPQPPAGVNVRGNCGNFDAVLHWTRGEELGVETRGFFIEFSTNVTAAKNIWFGGEGDPLMPGSMIIAEPGTQISFNLNKGNLVPGANLIFRLKGFSDHLVGSPSRPSKVGQCITPPSKPPMNPLNVTGITKMKPGVLFVSWRAITDVYYGDVGFFYEVGYRAVGATSFTVKEVRDLNVTEFEIPTPGINKEYEFYVRSNNIQGPGPDPVTVKAFSGKEPPTSPPRNFKVNSITRYTVDFTWNKVDNADGYRVKYWNITDAENLRGRLRRAITDPIVYNYQYFIGVDYQYGGSLVNMSAQLTFLATISSLNSGGFSPESDVISFESQARVPDAPYGVQFRVFGQSAHMSWQPPLNPNGYIEQYEISWENSQLENQPIVVIKAEKLTVDRRSREAYLINKFVPLTYYSVRMNARNRIGPGGDWEKILVAVSADDIPGKPGAPKAVPFDDTAINVTFQLPSYGGLPSMFYIFYRPRGDYFKEPKNVSQLFPQQAWFLVKDLDFVPYDFWTVGVNSLGQSETSDVTEQRPIRALKPQAHASQFPWYRSNWFIAVGLCLLFIAFTMLTLIFLLRTGPVAYKSLKEDPDYKYSGNSGFPSGGVKMKTKKKEQSSKAAAAGAAFSATDDQDNPPPRYSDQDSIDKKSPTASRSGSEGSRTASKSHSENEYSESESGSGSEYSDEEQGSYYSDEEKKKDSEDEDNDDDAEDTSTFV